MLYCWLSISVYLCFLHLWLTSLWIGLAGFSSLSLFLVLVKCWLELFKFVCFCPGVAGFLILLQVFIFTSGIFLQFEVYSLIDVVLFSFRYSLVCFLAVVYCLALQFVQNLTLGGSVIFCSCTFLLSSWISIYCLRVRFPSWMFFRMISILHSVVLVCELVLCCFSIESFFLLIHLFLLLGNSICLVIVVWFLACCQFHQIGFGLYCCPLDSFCLKSTLAHFDWLEFPFFDFWVFSVSLLVVSVGWFHYSSIIWDFISLILSIIIIFNALVR